MCKWSAANLVAEQHKPMKQAKKKAPKTTLQALFIRRVQQEMDARDLSENALCARVGGLKQRTLNDVMNGADPRLETVYKIATALGINPWHLFLEAQDIPANVRDRGVLNFPSIPHLANSGKLSHRPTRYRNKKG